MPIPARRRHRPNFGTDTGFCLLVSTRRVTVMSSLVAKFARDEEVSTLQDTKTRCDRHSVKVFDFYSFDVLIHMIDGDFEQVAVL